MIWRRLKKASKEEDLEFRERMSSVDVTRKDKLAMLLSAFLVIVLPCLLILGVFSLLMLWIFGAL